MTRAASFFFILALSLGIVVPCAAQEPTGANRPFQISDNSFLVEEAFNQELNVVQNIFSFMRSSDGRYDGSYTQEWPVGGHQHQFSYTVPFAIVAGRRGVGDVLLNYRYQATEEHGAVPAFSPRVSIVVPSGSQSRGFGSGVYGWQVNLPFSKQVGNVYFHWNVGGTYLPHVHEGAADRTAGTNLWSPTVAGSAIVRVAPMFNLMLETVAFSNESLVSAGVTDHARGVIVSPGFRGGWNLAEKQVIVGIAFPTSYDANADRSYGVLTYFSYELPFGPTAKK